MKSKLILLACIFYLGACQSDTGNKAKIYFDLKGFIDAQIKLLDKTKPAVLKTVIVGDKKEVKTIKDIDWAKELELFLQADINKSAYSQSYDNLSENGLKWYSLKIGEKIPVKKLVIQLNDEDIPVQIEAIIQTDNNLYSSEKKLQMNCENGHIKSYFIEGYQKVILGDKKTFKILGVMQ